MYQAKFSPEDLKIIGRLKKQQRDWRIARWIVLVHGLLCLFMGFFLANFEFRLLRDASKSQDVLISFMQNHPELQPSQLIADFSTIADTNQDQFGLLIITLACLFFLIKGLWLILLAIVNWHGNPTKQLLLKLVEIVEEKSSIE